MCYLCYHKKGRTKLAFGCEHKNEVHYSKGLCQACYIAQYAEVRFDSLQKCKMIECFYLGEKEETSGA